MSEVKVESHNVGPTFSRLTSLSFHVNRASRAAETCGLGGLVRLEPKLMGAIKSGRN